jgi:hypothetical protein
MPMKNRTWIFGIVLFLSSLLPARLQAGESGDRTGDFSSTEAGRGGMFIDEFGVGTGYAWTYLKQTNASYKEVPAYVRIGFDMNGPVGMRGRKGTLQMAIEPFVNTVTAPDKGVEAGFNLLFRYLHPLSSSVKLVSEIGTGPVYFGIDTDEQGGAGFNFLSQFGLGTQVLITKKSAITFGYRFRHLSNAGFNHSNAGINTNMLTLSLSTLYW